MSQLKIGPARPQDHGELMELLNNVFFRDDSPEEARDFLALLPKLYKPEYRPWENNYCVWEDGVIKAAVGMYVTEAEIAGERLRCGGIGNVAVARDSRRKGYMKLAMDAAMDAMKAADCAFGELGGQRQRYQFWGFERGGMAVNTSFSRKNLRHAFGTVAPGASTHGDNDLTPGWRADPVEPDDTAALAGIRALIEAAPLHVIHAPAAMYDILSSWSERPYMIRHEGRFAGFFTLDRFGRSASQLHLRNVTDLEMALRSVYAVLPEDVDSVSVVVPLWETALLEKAEEIGENAVPADTGMYTIFSWELMLRALLRLQAQCRSLPDGTMTVRIEGMAGPETLRIAVKDGVPSVAAAETAPEQTLGHLQAERFFLAPWSRWRVGCPLAQAWFPLPLMMHSLDKV
ncbi:MAG: GNAT family N-acetyltransferase [Oscillospiraceae bacterium]|jgi:predicted N-acetyltransferase YhbS|nr:GNAT family N-acetyltransferase [Oscillospiraceae bacterium]